MGERWFDRREWLEMLSPAEMMATALHPRLRQQMSIADIFCFVAAHDDHPLARIAELADLG